MRRALSLHALLTIYTKLTNITANFFIENLGENLWGRLQMLGFPLNFLQKGKTCQQHVKKGTSFFENEKSVKCNWHFVKNTHEQLRFHPDIHSAKTCLIRQVLSEHFSVCKYTYTQRSVLIIHRFF